MMFIQKTPKYAPEYWVIGFALFLAMYVRFFINIFNVPWLSVVDDILVIMTFSGLLLVGRLKVKHAILNKPILFFLFFFTWSAVYNEVQIDIALMQLRSYILMIGLYYIIMWGSISNYEIIKLLKLIFLLALPIFIFSIIEFSFGKSIIVTVNRYGDLLTDSSIFRSHGIIGNPVDYANLVIMILAIILSAIINKYSLISQSKLTSSVLFLTIFATLFISNSRGPIIALMLTVLILSIFLRAIPIRKILIGMVILLIMTTWFGSDLIYRMSQLNVDEFSNDTYRMFYLMKSFEIFLDNFFIGVGPGMFGGWVSINYSDSYIYEMYDISAKGVSSIDMFFPHLFVEVGVLGFLAYLSLYVRPFFYFKRLYNKSKYNQTRFICLIILLIVPMLLIVGWFNISLESQLVFPLYATLLGLSEKYIRNLRSKGEPL
jgi:hypothetical protein